MLRTKIKQSIIGLAAILLSTGAVQNAQARSLQEIQKTKTLVLVYPNNIPPFQFKPTPTSQPVGFEIDLVRQIANDLGVTLITKENNTYAGMVNGLKNGDYDIAAAGFALTSTRDKDVDLTIPYGCAAAGLITFQPGLNTLHDFKNKKVIVPTGSVYESFALKTLPRENVVSLAESTQILKALMNKEGDAAIAWRAMIPFLAKVYNLDLKDTPPLFTTTVGFMIDPKGVGLKAALDRRIYKMKTDGTISNLDKKYFPNDSIMCR